MNLNAESASAGESRNASETVRTISRTLTFLLCIVARAHRDSLLQRCKLRRRTFLTLALVRTTLTSAR